MDIKDYCNGDYYILCICEGSAEEDIINWLMDEDRLYFNRGNLIDKRPIRTRKVTAIEQRYLSLDYDKPLVIFRVIDSKNEKFSLGKLFRDRFNVKTFITNPEIEVLMIIHKGDLAKYSRKYTKTKPSDFAKSQYKIKGIKNKDVMKEFFNNDIEKLIQALQEHKHKKSNSAYTIYDLLRNE